MARVLSDSLTKRVLLAGGLLAAALLFAYGFLIAKHGELADKEAYAVLQRLESEHRNDVSRQPYVVIRGAFGTSYDAMGLLSNDRRFPIVWILLSHLSASGEVMMIPSDAKPIVPCDQITHILAGEVMKPEVRNLLMSKCTVA